MPTHTLIFLTILVATCAYGGVRGGQVERCVAAAFLVAGPLTLALGRMFGRHTYHALELEVIAVDVALFVVLVAVALFSARFWPMPMASMQGAELLAHLAKPLGSDVVPAAYYAIVAYWSYPMMALLAIGTLRHRRRLARYTIDYDWAAALPPSYRAGGKAVER